MKKTKLLTSIASVAALTGTAVAASSCTWTYKDTKIKIGNLVNCTWDPKTNILSQISLATETSIDLSSGGSTGITFTIVSGPSEVYIDENGKLIIPADYIPP